MTLRTVPHSIDAEKSVLGSIKVEESLLLNVKPTSCLTVFLVTPNVSLSSQRQE